MSETLKDAVKNYAHIVAQKLVVRKGLCTIRYLQALLQVAMDSNSQIASSLKLLDVLHLSDLEPDLLKVLVKQGIEITSEDISKAITLLTNKQVQLLDVLTTEVVDTPDYNKLWHLTITEKPRLARHFLKCGANPKVIDVMKRFSWKKCDDDCAWMIEYITKHCSSDERTNLVMEAIDNSKEHLIKDILAGGPIKGNALSVKRVLNIPRLTPALLNELIMNGMVITTDDIRHAVETFSDSQVELVKVLTKETKDPLNYTKLLHLAADHVKPSFAEYFLTFGAELSIEDIVHFLRSKKSHSLSWMIDNITKNCSSHSQTIILLKAIENKKMEFAKQVLMAGSVLGSEINISQVLSVFGSDVDNLKKIIAQGMTITADDIRDAIKILSDEQIEGLEVLTNAANDPPDYTMLWHLAINDKPRMASHFLTCGAKLSVADVIDKFNWNKFDTYLFDYIAKKCSPDERTTLVVRAIENGKEDIAKQLLSEGSHLGITTSASLIFHIPGLRPDLLKGFTELGLTISEEDIKNSVSLLSDQQENLLSVLTDHVKDSPDYVSLWYQSIKVKPKLASHFFKCWRQCSKCFEHESSQCNEYDYISRHCSAHSRTSLVVKAIENKDERFAEQLSSDGPICGDEINLGSIISSLAKFQLHTASFVLGKLVENRVNPNGVPNTGRKPIESLLLLQDMDSTVVSSLLCTLLKQVPSIDNVELDDIQSTVIHEVTKLSLKAGKVHVCINVYI